MIPARIRLSKNRNIDSKEVDLTLKNVWETTYTVTRGIINKYSGAKIRWNGAEPNDDKVKDELTKTILDSIEEWHSQIAFLTIKDMTGAIDINFGGDDGFKVAILNYDPKDKSLFKIGLVLFSEELTLIDSIGENLLLTRAIS
jgi:hypothetical protein